MSIVLTKKNGMKIFNRTSGINEKNYKSNDKTSPYLFTKPLH